MIGLKRIYDYKDEDGFGILIDGIWPRGVRKESIDLWMRELAPSPELRKWYSHDPAKCSEFRKRYLEELRKKSENVKKVIDLSRKKKGGLA